MWEEFSFYFGRTDLTGAELDWAIMFVGTNLPKWQNLLLVMAAYPLQVFLVLILGVFAVLMTRHNVFFLRRVYQRSRIPAGEAANFITIDLDDVNRCFGFRVANRAFNVQIMLLAAIGAGLLVSRFLNVDAATGLFRDPGQVGMAVGWLAGLVIATLPAWVKFLPWLPRKGRLRDTSIVAYLREFFPEDQWPYGDPPAAVVVSTMSARFAQNAFWPTGNNRAARLFFLAFLALCFLIVPDLGIVLGQFESTERLATRSSIVFVTSLAIYSALAYLFTCGLLWSARSWLGYIDERLVASPDEPPMTIAELNAMVGATDTKADVGVFVSYRWSDTAAYAGRIKDNLEEHVDNERVFYDRDRPAPGTVIDDTIHRAIEASDVMVAIIGPRWQTIESDGGQEKPIGGPDGYVLLEIAAALRHKLPIIPVLVGGATMPERGELPADIEHLCRLEAVEITDARWEYDFARLVDSMLKFKDHATP
jgi:hypothetical protein